MALARLTKLRYMHYLHHVHQVMKLPLKSNKFKHSACDVLYTFIDYYRHLGETPIGKHRGQIDILILQQFQAIYKKYHMSKSLTTLSIQTLLKALSSSLIVMSIWYYATKQELNIRVVNFNELHNQQEIINRTHQMEHKIRKLDEKVLQFSLSKNQALFLTIAKNNIK